MRLELNALALEVVADTLFDIDIGEGDSETIREALADISKILVTDADKMIPRPDWWPTRREPAQEARDREDRGDHQARARRATDV